MLELRRNGFVRSWGKVKTLVYHAVGSALQEQGMIVPAKRNYENNLNLGGTTS